MAAVEQGADKEKGLITSKSIKAKRNTSPPRLELIGGQTSSHITSVQYCGGCSVHWGDNISTVGDSFSPVGG